MEVLLKPIITEKMVGQGDKLNRYGFIVDKNANKLQIKKAIEDMYGVSVEDVNTMRFKGKFKTRYTKTGIVSGRKNACKKALVTLADKDKIDFYSNI